MAFQKQVEPGAQLSVAATRSIQESLACRPGMNVRRLLEERFFDWF